MDETKEKVDTIAVDIYDYMSASIISILINFILLISILEDQEFGVILFVNTLIASMILLTFISQKDEIKLIRKNSMNFLKDASKEVELLKAKFTKSEFINSDGTIDKWRLPESVKSIEESIDKQFEKFKDELLEKLEQGDKNVGIKNTTTE